VDNYANFRGLSAGRADHSWLKGEPQLPNFRVMKLDVPITGDSFQDRKSLRFTWKDLAWIRSLTKLPIVLKGLVTAEDARLAVDHGVDGIIVSNHGGHALASYVGTAPKLIEVVKSVAGQAEVYVDGGIRTGADVLKALAIGARAVLVARPQAWGLINGGAAGVRSAIEVLRDELHTAMGLCGVVDVKNISPSLVRYDTSSKA
jgi:(S)-2-hydroxy-acid oxidase